MTDYQVRLRLFLFQLAIILFFGLFILQLWRLQILEGEKYQKLANLNRFRSVEIEAPRGIIYDRKGNLMVRNRPVFDVVIVPAYLPDDTTLEAQVFARLATLLKLPITNSGRREIASHNAYFRSFLHHEYTRLPDRQVRNSRSRLLAKTPQGIKDAVYNAPIFASYQSVVIATDVAPEVAAIIEEERLNLAGVFIQTSSERDYLTGVLTSELLGYVGPIPLGQADRYPVPVYNPNDDVGLVGLEYSYEEYLHGIKGQEIVEVDVTGRKIKTIGDSVAAQPGDNLILTIDLELQTFVAQKLQTAIEDSRGQSGAAIVINPQNGEILAMVSLPGYDNNLFAQGISAREYGLLSEDKSTPLVNKAIGGLYPPGSTFKIVPAAGALEEGTVSPQQQFLAQGVLYLPNKFYPDDPELAQPFYCWYREGHGLVDLVSGLAFSCDIYFYQIGGGYEPSGYEGLGRDKLIEYAERFGFGSPTGIDIPGEGAGLVPTPKWKRLNYAETWVTGDTYNMSIGQGFVLATPLQIVNAYAALANGGLLYKPHLVKEIRNPQKELIHQTQPEVIGSLNLSAETRGWVEEGLRAVVEWGTAKEAIDLPGVSVSAKTGTAEYCDRYPQCLDRDGRVRTSHAWFIAYAPSQNAQVAIVAFIYGGGEGSVAAAPVVNAVLRHYFEVDQPEDETDNRLPENEIRADASFSARLLGSDAYPSPAVSIHGFALDEQGEGIAQVAVALLADGEIAAQTSSGVNGQFDFNSVDPQLADHWQIHLTDYPASDVIDLEISAGTRYFIEFQALEPNDDS